MQWKKSIELRSKNNFYLFVCFLSLCFLYGCKLTNKHPGKQQLNVALAANAAHALEEIKTAFETAYPEISVHLILGSSGKLTAQIEQGAPFHVFLSADMKYPRQLLENGLAIGDIQTYAFGQLILWSLDKQLIQGASISILSREEVDCIAIASPTLAPYGKQSELVLKRLSLFDSIESKLVYGENISQATQFVYSGSCAIGFTAKSMLYTPALKEKAYWLPVPADLYEPVEQGAVLTTVGQKEQATASRLFLEYLNKADSRGIFINNGYFLKDTIQ